MAFKFRLPDIGEGIAEGEIVKWDVKEGDTIQEDDKNARASCSERVSQHL